MKKYTLLTAILFASLFCNTGTVDAHIAPGQGPNSGFDHHLAPPLPAPEPPMAGDPVCYLYFAGGLFNLGQTEFNTKTVDMLETDGGDGVFYTVFLPQRDGFLFVDLSNKIFDILNLNRNDPGDAAEVLRAVQIIIYYLDQGFFSTNAHVTLARLDEPLDPGVIIEVAFGKLMTKPVIIYKTDVLSNYGTYEDRLGGIHFFPAFQATTFIVDDFGRDGFDERLKRAIRDELSYNNIDCNTPGADLIPSEVIAASQVNDYFTGSEALFANLIPDSINPETMMPFTPREKLSNPDNYPIVLAAIKDTSVGGGLQTVVENYQAIIEENPHFFTAYPGVISNIRLPFSGQDEIIDVRPEPMP